MMVLHFNRLIGLCRGVLHAIMAPKRSAIFTCFVIIVFVNLLTCHQTAEKISPIPPPNAVIQRAHAQDSLKSTIVTTPSSTNAPETIDEIPGSDVTTLGPSNLRENLKDAHYKNLANNSAEVPRDQSSEFQHNEPEIRLLENRLGPLASAKIYRDKTTTLKPVYDYNHDDELRRIYLGKSSTASDTDATTIENSLGELEIHSTSSNYTAPETLNSSTPFQDLQLLNISSPSVVNATLYHKSRGDPVIPLSFIKKTARAKPVNNNQNFVPPTLRPFQEQSTRAESEQTPVVPPLIPSPDLLIPNASLLDLLNIIKHLNLISGDDESRQIKSETAISDQLLNANSIIDPVRISAKADPIPFQFKRDHWLDGEHQIHSKQLVPLSDMGQAVKHTSSVASSLPDMLATLESAAPEHSKSADGGSTNHANDLTNTDATKINSKFTNLPTTRRPHKYSLISPYSASFDTGLDQLLNKNPSINRATVVSLKDQFKAQNQAYGHDSRFERDDGKQKLKIGAKPVKDQLGSKPENVKSSLGAYYPIEEEGSLIKPSRKLSRQQKPPPDIKVKSKTAARQKSGGTSLDSNSKRGERDIEQRQKDQENVSGNKINSAKELSSTKIKHNDLMKSLGPATSDLQTRQYKKKEPPYQIMDSSSVTSAQARPILYPTKSDNQVPTSTQHIPLPVASYLDDPHKKSYYWTTEQTGLYLDDLNNLAQPPGQLTIGELAHQQGITPLGMQAPPFLDGFQANLNQPHHPYSMMGDPFGLSAESGIEEDYSHFHHNHQPPSNRIKIDDELKRKIAVKAIEAATRDPELAATIFGSLMSMQAEGESTSQTLSSMAGLNRPSHQSQEPNLSIDIKDSRPNNHRWNSDVLPSHTSISRPQGSELPSTMSLGSHLNNLGMIMPMATIQDSRVVNSTAAQPVNLVITDLANKWALSRMPDLVPIPLAATVPGYLIRLPNGKILAAALTNMFSIQGIQRGPLASSYKGLINNKFKGLIKQSSSPGKTMNHYGNVVADSGFRPTVVLPAGHYPYGIMRTTEKSVVLKNQQHNQNHRDKGGIFSRGVLKQLVLGGSNTGHRDSHRLSKYPSGKTSTKGDGTSKSSGSQHKTRIIKLTNSPFPVPALTDQELANLPIATPDEPVYSFADESQIVDQLDHQRVDSSLIQMSQTGLPSGPGDPDQYHQVYHSSLDPLQILSNGSNLPNLRGKLSHALNNSKNIAHLSAVGEMNGDNFFNYRSKKRKSLPRTPLSLESVYQWFASKRAQTLYRDSKRCTETT